MAEQELQVILLSSPLTTLARSLARSRPHLAGKVGWGGGGGPHMGPALGGGPAARSPPGSWQWADTERKVADLGGHR